MTIYSQHANRGKVQILATFEGPNGIGSSTVTSVGGAEQAVAIVDALNRISSLATVPVSIHDMRDQRVEQYPDSHLDALTDRGAWDGLLDGAHSLWYEYVRLELHRALADLDKALATAPDPVRLAINAELETEVRELRLELAIYRGTEPDSEAEPQRLWDFEAPFVRYDGGFHALGREVRKQMDSFEADATRDELKQAVSDLRVLAEADSQCDETEAQFEPGHLEIFYEPYAEGRYFLTVNAPHPGARGSESWVVEISQWVPDDPDDEDEGDASGRSLLCCALPAQPSAQSIAELVRRVDAEPELLATLAKTPLGDVLPGTDFVATSVIND